MKCPCNSGKKYSICCNRYHLDHIRPPTAEALLRARYSAYVLNKNHFIFNTWHSETRPTLAYLYQLKKKNYLTLEIRNTDMGLNHHDIGSVTFHALYQEERITKEHNEVSLFKREKGKWLYFKGLLDT